MLGIQDHVTMNSYPISSGRSGHVALIEAGISDSPNRLLSYQDLASLMQDKLGKLFSLEGPFSSLADCRSVLEAVNRGINDVDRPRREETLGALRAICHELQRSDPDGVQFKEIDADLEHAISQWAWPSSKLKPNVVMNLTEFLAEEELRAAGALNRAFRKATEGRRLARQIRRHFSVGRPQGDVIRSFQKFLARIKSLDGYMQQAPLMSLSWQLSDLNDLDDRTKVFDQILCCVEAMPPDFRSKPLMALVQLFFDIWEEDRPERFDAILNLVNDTPFDERWPVLKELAGSLSDLSGESVTSRFRALWDVANEMPLARRSEFLVTLVEKLSCIPSKGMKAWYEQFLQTTPLLPADGQVAVLTALAIKCAELPEEVTKDGLHAVCDGAKTLPDAQRAPVLACLARHLVILWRDRTSLLQVLNAILASLETMAEGREEVLIAAANGLYFLGGETKFLASKAILQFADQLAPEQRARVQARLETKGF